MMDEEITEQEIQPEPSKYSGLFQCIFTDGTIQYDGQKGTPDQFPLTEAELFEVMNA